MSEHRISDEVARRIEEWQAIEREVRARLAPPGKIPVAELGQGSGLDFLQRIGRGELPSTPIGRVMGFVPIEAEPGRMIFQGTPSADYYNPIGTIHGGYIATLLDSAVGCAVHTMVRHGHGYTTLELKVNYVRALTEGVGPVRAEGKVINLSRQIGIAEGRLYDAAGKLYAHATTTCLIFPIGSAARTAGATIG
jgi:uncharacterized protein (TIGR00369 family)